MKRWLFRFALWLSEWTAPDPPPPPPPDPQAEYHAVRAACGYVGLDYDACTPEFDLRQTGKFLDVVYHAARALGRTPPMRTVADAVDVLKRLES